MLLAAVVAAGTRLAAYYKLSDTELVDKLSCVRNLPGAYIFSYQ
jgi:hypothetical protein